MSDAQQDPSDDESFCGKAALDYVLSLLLLALSPSLFMKSPGLPGDPDLPAEPWICNLSSATPSPDARSISSQCCLLVLDDLSALALAGRCGHPCRKESQNLFLGDGRAHGSCCTAISERKLKWESRFSPKKICDGRHYHV